jgi:hypothetical protein
MGQDFIEHEFGVPAANARRNGERLFELVSSKVQSKVQGSMSKVCLA